MHRLELTAIGDAVGVVLPREILARLHLVKGDVVYLTETPDGLRLTPHDPEAARQLDEAARIMKRRRQALRELAK